MIDQARQQRQGGLDPVLRLSYCPPRRPRPVGDHRPHRFIAFFIAHISNPNTPLAYRGIAGPASRLGLLTSQGRRPKHLQNATSRETPQRMVCRGLRCVVTEKRFILKIYRSSLPLREQSRSDASRVAVHLPVGRGLYQAGSIAGAQPCAHLCARFALFVFRLETLRINVRKVSRRKSTKPVKGPTLPENRRASDGVSRVLSPLLNESRRA